MATEQFVIDGICHPYNFSEENLKGRFGRIFNDVLYAFHPLNPPDTVLSKEEWQHDWQNDEFLESDTDMACVHSVPVFDAYHDGLVSVEKGADLKRRYPDRTIWYATCDVFQDEPALESLEPKSLVIMEGGKHFDAYTEPGLSQSAPPAVAWFERHLMGRQPAQLPETA